MWISVIGHSKRDFDDNSESICGHIGFQYWISIIRYSIYCSILQKLLLLGWLPALKMIIKSNIKP